VAAVEAELTQLHAAAIAGFARGIRIWRLSSSASTGTRSCHRPAERRTWQIGDGALLARLAGIDVVADFPQRRCRGGGEGAPLAPLYHAALAADLAKPVAVLNLGGVGNVTWIGQAADEILAFDTGPGNALIDDWVRTHTGRAADFDGALARAGQVSAQHVARFLALPYFRSRTAEISRRDDFQGTIPNDLGVADGAATLTEMTAASVRRRPGISRGRRANGWCAAAVGHNPAIMVALARHLGVSVRPVETVGWNGDALEAQAFAYLAVRSCWPAIEPALDDRRAAPGVRRPRFQAAG